MNLKTLAITVLLLGLSACGKDGETSQAPTPTPPAKVDTFQKLGDLSQVNYRSEGCTAVVSGVDRPMQLLLSYRCSYVHRAHTLACSSNYFCTGIYEDNNKIEVGLSQDFKQMTVVWYKSDGTVGDSENFLISK